MARRRGVEVQLGVRARTAAVGLDHALEVAHAHVVGDEREVLAAEALLGQREVARRPGERLGRVEALVDPRAGAPHARASRGAPAGACSARCARRRPSSRAGSGPSRRGSGSARPRARRRRAPARRAGRRSRGTRAPRAGRGSRRPLARRCSIERPVAVARAPRWPPRRPASARTAPGSCRPRRAGRGRRSAPASTRTGPRPAPARGAGRGRDDRDVVRASTRSSTARHRHQHGGDQRDPKSEHPV